MGKTSLNAEGQVLLKGKEERKTQEMTDQARSLRE